MNWLNYHHLLYFYTVAREGSVKEAATVLRLAQPTLSTQIRKLEESLGESLFDRRGRQLVLTEVGQMAYQYAEEIFSLGREMVDAVHGRPTDRPARLRVGIADVVPKVIAQRLLQSVLDLEDPVQLILHEGKSDELAAALALQEFDLVLTDAPIRSQIRVKAFHHPLGSCGIGIFGSPELARRLAPGFPASLDGAPMLLPTVNTVLRHALDLWFEKLDLRPRIVAEIEDSALLKSFGQHGNGVFVAPIAVADEVCRAHGVRQIGQTDEVRTEFYAITVERRITHPAVAEIARAAREGVLVA